VASFIFRYLSGMMLPEKSNSGRRTLSVLFGSLSGAVIGRGSGTTFLNALQTVENGCGWVAGLKAEEARAAAGQQPDNRNGHSPLL
jgi:hypothetical protein